MPPRALPKFCWLVRLKHARKTHITASTEFGEPWTETLCGKKYDPADRTYAKKLRRSEGAECRACLAILDKVWAVHYKLFVKLGNSEDAAKTLADYWFDWPDPD